MKALVFASIILIILIAGCTEDEVRSAELNKNFDLRAGQTSSIEGEDIKIKFLSVTEDSRCPSDVICVWQGEVKVIVQIEGEHTENISLTNSDTEESFQGYKIKLVQVQPYPDIGNDIEPSEYKIKLVVSKN